MEKVPRREQCNKQYTSYHTFLQWCAVAVTSSKSLRHRRCRLKKELEEGAVEKCTEDSELTSPVDCHQKVRDIKVKGAPGTKVESMKVIYLVPLY